MELSKDRYGCLNRDNVDVSVVGCAAAIRLLDELLDEVFEELLGELRSGELGVLDGCRVGRTAISPPSSFLTPTLIVRFRLLFFIPP